MKGFEHPKWSLKLQVKHNVSFLTSVKTPGSFTRGHLCDGHCEDTKCAQKSIVTADSIQNVAAAVTGGLLALQSCLAKRRLALLESCHNI